jgi:signal transduction histidine kinase
MNPLGTQLKQRTQELTSVKLKLKHSIAREDKCDRVLKQSRRHYTKLLKESLQLQQGLRLLSRHLLKTQEKDRRAMGRELQDKIAQTLLGITLQIENFKKEALLNTQSLQQEIAHTQQIVSQTASSVLRVARKPKSA